ncbi:sialate O-acetylesterase [Latilactobacillus sakei]|uniref:sialate O-acetylesterase n=1 Tax=Latilactobacillus sakei TaxID=1599 RepID=UPI003F536B76
MMKSILLVGQSNMAGRGFIQDVPVLRHERVKMLRNGRWQMMAEPIHFDREVAGVGPATSFAAAWVQAHPDEELGLIPCAEGGSSIDEWASDEVLMRHAIAEAKFAQESSELIGVLWHQGESDSLKGGYQTYAAKLTAVFSHLRQALGQANLPIIVGQLPDFLGQEGFGASATEFNDINREMANVVAQDPHSYLVNAAELTANPDGIHIDAASQRRFGLRYYAAFANQEDVLTVLPDEAIQLEALYQRPETPQEKMYRLSRAFALGQMSYPEFIAQLTGEGTAK